MATDKESTPTYDTAADAPTAAPASAPEVAEMQGSPAKTSPAKPQRTFAATTWAALIIGALLLIVLLVFIMQNQQSVELTLFAWSFSFPAGVGFLLAAIAGALIMALVGGVRMMELRRLAKKNSR
ncbi:LapA family protein [Corynebacterium lowii]|uniref:Lipopolysaccharide assembly protein A domain-containing protein n=1 Tax=Corynebacterium lowii TaxID=1544413 RepID=A0A0Q0YIR1_9CORY|nr:lipopolysaccharide assembly protein LapA domain-containing protein [Corynebacterium lowii]KQB86627.1 hypothetical protein Clow_00835 [Corynebacterium lowii]MDP9851311.1 putative integral membrane protein [Corynebacterium lowii]